MYTVIVLSKNQDNNKELLKEMTPKSLGWMNKN